jgi:lipopolysaccharide export LptBFGC system permease protein LptF
MIVSYLRLAGGITCFAGYIALVIWLLENGLQSFVAAGVIPAIFALLTVAVALFDPWLRTVAKATSQL